MKARLTTVVIVLLLLTPTFAQGAKLGVRTGLTFDPDQFHIGGHWDMGLLAKRIGIRPNVELGFGDNVLVFALNLEGVYRFEQEWQTWSPYVGGGLGINRVDLDDDRLQGDSSTETGLLISGGIERGLASGGRFFLESKLGLGNAPDLKLTAGWTFGG